MAARGAPMVKVYYGKPMLPDVSRVLACLYEKEVDFRLVDMYEGQHMSMDFLRLQVAARLPVPCLEDGSTPVFESRTICRYVVEKYPDSGNKYLLGRDVLERASIEQWLKTEEHSFDPPSWALIFHLAFPPMAGIPEPDRALAAQNEKRLAKVLDVYEQRLGETNYLAGNKFSLADLSHLSNSYFLARSEEWGNLFDSRKNVRKWWKKISNRPSWKEAVKILDKVGILKPTIPASAESALQSFSMPKPSSPGVQPKPSSPAESALQSFSKSTPSSPGVQSMPSSPGVQPIILGHIPGYGHTASTAPSPETASNFQPDSITQPLSPQPVEEPATETSQKTLLPSTGQSSRQPSLASPTTQPTKLVSVQPIPPQPTTTQLPSTGQPPLVALETAQPTIPASVQPTNPEISSKKFDPNARQITKPEIAPGAPAEKIDANTKPASAFDQNTLQLGAPTAETTASTIARWKTEMNLGASTQPGLTAPVQSALHKEAQDTRSTLPPVIQNTKPGTTTVSTPSSLSTPQTDASISQLDSSTSNTTRPETDKTTTLPAQTAPNDPLTDIANAHPDPQTKQATTTSNIPRPETDENSRDTTTQLAETAPNMQHTAASAKPAETDVNSRDTTTQPSETAPNNQTNSASRKPAGTNVNSRDTTTQPAETAPNMQHTAASAKPAETDVNSRDTTTQPSETAPTKQTNSASRKPAGTNMNSRDTTTQPAETAPNMQHTAASAKSGETDVNSRDTATQPAETAPNKQTNSASRKPAGTDVNSRDTTAQPAKGAPYTSASGKPAETDVNSRDSTTQVAKTAPNTQTTSASAEPTVAASAPGKRSDLQPVIPDSESSATTASTVPTAPSIPQRDTPNPQRDPQNKQPSQPNGTGQFNA